MAHASTSANLSVSRLFDFSKHVVLVTGGATGLGEMAAQAFIQNGAYVLIASRKKSALEETAKRLNQLGPGKCDYIVADLKDKAGCLALCEEVKKKTDRLTVLLNNSGATWVRGDIFFFFFFFLFLIIFPFLLLYQKKSFLTSSLMHTYNFFSRELHTTTSPNPAGTNSWHSTSNPSSTPPSVYTPSSPSPPHPTTHPE